MAYKPGAQHSNVDGFSPLPLPDVPDCVPLMGEMVLLMWRVFRPCMPVTPTQIDQWTDCNPLLARLHNNILRSWQHLGELDMQPYQLCQVQLSVQDGCVL